MTPSELAQHPRIQNALFEKFRPEALMEVVLSVYRESLVTEDVARMRFAPTAEHLRTLEVARESLVPRSFERTLENILTEAFQAGASNAERERDALQARIALLEHNITVLMEGVE